MFSRSRLSRGIKVTQGHIMLLSDPIRFQFYGFLCVLGFFHLHLLDHPCARSLNNAKAFDLEVALAVLDQWIMNLISKSDLFSSFRDILSQESNAPANFSSSDILFDSIDNIYIFNPATLHFLIHWERWIHPIVHMELRWKSQVYFSHSHLSMFWKYISVLSCISKHILSYASFKSSRAERWVCAAVSYFLVMILPFQLQKQSGSDCGTE